ncbi:sulfatase-like hydrolase/transferase [Marinoscillum furvescens]|uniref:Putative secreted protein (Por secretion system target) n=1 Tax=Marinoscillum furvescens DSM 4134 TaxID=1122208 RepID=A0A3D9KYJ9_MARFU|nr:sulfatase-like hydrolase/transferase [Marinoscillum furvescens]RED94659.1 putative secreted protein (Por secretion system target) [Marinoscillum furvescens DSM 4134]
MKRRLLILKSALVVCLLGCAVAAQSQTFDDLSQNFTFTFSVDGDPGLWDILNDDDVVANGHLAAASSGSNKDIRYNNGFANADFTLIPAEDVYIAIKYIGPFVGANPTIQFNSGGAGGWGAKPGPTGTFTTKAGNEVKYYLLSDVAPGDYTQATYNLTSINVFNRNTTAAYAVDWIATFSSVADIEAAALLADDGAGDQDEVVPVSADLKELSVEGVSLYPGFDPKQLSYETILAEGSTEVPPVTAKAEDPNASVVITPAEELPGTTTVMVSTEDGSTSIVYSIYFRVNERQVTDRPNIIYLMTDDQRWDNMGCYGRPEFNTPHIDSLAEEGVVFDNAAYAVAICMPSRVTMLSGRYLSNHQTGFAAPSNLTFPVAEFAETYPAKLKEAGYRNGFIGKFGFTVTDERQRPSNKIPDGYTYKSKVGDVFDFFAGAETRDDHPTHGVQIWPEDDLGLQQIYHTGRPRTERTLKTGDAMLRFIDTQPADQPFCLTTFFYAVKHDGNEFPAEHYDLFKNQNFSVPDNYVEGPNNDLPQVVQDYARGFRLHVERTATLEQYQEQVREFATQGYSVDAQVGKLVAKLKERGMLDNTIIIYSSDNGRFQGSHGLYDKALLYEESIKQPLIVFDGRKAAAERKRREAAMISSVDIAPTILSLAGVEVPEMMQGSDFSGVLDQTQEMSEWQDAVFIEDRFLSSMIRKTPEQNDAEVAAGKSYRAHGVRTAKWKYFVYHEQDPVIEELYDLENDSLEQNNLAGDEAYASVLKELRKRTEELYAKARGLAKDCSGVYGGTAMVDDCGVCSGGDTGVEPSSPAVWYEDADGDGLGDSTSTVSECVQPEGYVAEKGDECPDNGDKVSAGECGCEVAEGECGTILGSEKLFDGAAFYPNPATGQITIRAEKGCLVEIYSVDGTQKLKFKMVSKTRRVSLMHLDSGLYLVRLKMQNRTIEKKLVVD